MKFWITVLLVFSLGTALGYSFGFYQVGRFVAEKHLEGLFKETRLVTDLASDYERGHFEIGSWCYLNRMAPLRYEIFLDGSDELWFHSKAEVEDMRKEVQEYLTIIDETSKKLEARDSRIAEDDTPCFQ